MDRRRGRLRYGVGAGILLAVYAAVALVLWSGRDFDDRGPLSLHQPRLDEPLPGGVPLDQALAACFPDRNPSEDDYKLVGGLVDGRPHYACYELNRDSGSVLRAKVLAGDGTPVADTRTIKRGGAWPWVGTVKSRTDLVLGGAGVAVLLAWCALYYRRVRPGPATAGPWWGSGAVLGLLVLVPVAGWVALAVLPRVSGARKRRVVMQVLLGLAGLVLATLGIVAIGVQDPWGLTVVGLLWLALGFGVVAGRAWLAPAGFNTPDDLAATGKVQPLPPGEPAPAGRARPPEAGAELTVQRPGTLPSFADVGGMDALKRELKDTFGLMLAFAGEAQEYRITWNGLLLHGPPGVGKTFLARATAGEFGLNFIPLSVADLVSAYRGASARNVAEAFSFAARNLPCVLFFDEFDSIAQRREDWPDSEARTTVNQLLQSLEASRALRGLVVMAATNSLDRLDEAVTRPGRFDRHVRVDLPDLAGRAAIFAVQLRDRPTAPELDVDELAERSADLTPAAIAQSVELAALAALRESAAGGRLVPLDTERLLAAMRRRGGTDRPTAEDLTWDDVVLAAPVKAELRQIQRLVEDPERGQAFGVEPPTGVLLTGPPGTGKTTIAKILAAQASCSFYPVSAADLTSMWLGESEHRIQRLFERARENRPSIVFIDEIDAIASRRGTGSSYDPQVNQLLDEMDGVKGQRGVFVLAATNRPDQLDPALLRGGRLSRTITIPLPDKAGRAELLRLMTAGMPLDGVDLDGLAGSTRGLSGADIEALCQQAALLAMVRAKDGEQPAVTGDDFASALATRAPKGAAGAEQPRPEGRYL